MSFTLKMKPLKNIYSSLGLEEKGKVQQKDCGAGERTPEHHVKAF